MVSGYLKRAFWVTKKYSKLAYQLQAISTTEFKTCHMVAFIGTLFLFQFKVRCYQGPKVKLNGDNTGYFLNTQRFSLFSCVLLFLLHWYILTLPVLQDRGCREKRKRRGFEVFIYLLLMSIFSVLVFILNIFNIRVYESHK